MKNFQDYIYKNKSVLDRALNIDNIKWEEKLSFEDIIENKNLELTLEKNKTYLVIYEGQPILTKIILEKAIKSSANVIFTINDYYLATNTIILGIANKLIEENNIKCFFRIYNNVKENKIFENTKQVDTTIFIGDKENYDYMRAHVKGNLIKINYN